MTPTPTNKLLLTEREAVEMLGLSARTLFSLRQRGELAYVKIGSAIRYDPVDINALIEKHRKTSGD